MDSVSLNGFTHREAVEALCNAPPFCKLLIERSPRSRNSSVGSHKSPGSAGSPKDNRTDTNQKLETSDQSKDIYSIFVTEGLYH